jgi:hypothetical protein
MACANTGLVANSTSSGIPAARQRARSPILDPPRARVLPLHPGRAGALLDEPGVIDDQHTAPIAEPVDDVAAQVIAHAINVPVRAPQQPLHPIRRVLTSMLGQRPPVLALQPRNQPGHVLPHPSPRFRPPEPPRDTTVHGIQLF